MTNRELLEAAVVLRALEDPIPPHVAEDWFHWPAAAAAWRRIQQAQAAKQSVGLPDLLIDPATTAVCDAVPEVGLYFAHIQEAVDALQVYVDREWLGAQWRQALQSLNDAEDVRTVMSRLMTAIDRRLGEGPDSDLVSAQEAAMQVFTDMEQRLDGTSTRVLPYGWASWDALTEGMEGGQLVVLGARTGVGKTLVAGNLARNWALAGHGTLYFTLEMKARKIMARLLASESGLNSLVLARGTLHDGRDWSDLSRVLGRVSRWPIWFREKPTTLTQCAQMVRQAVRQYGIRAAVVDYAGLLGNEPLYRGESTAAQVGRIAKTLKNLAMELDIPVVALVQINRDAEKRGNRVPTIADLRDSGDWEANADVIWLFMDGEQEDELTALLGKNRDGQANVTIRMGWQKKSALIWDKEAM